MLRLNAKGKTRSQALKNYNVEAVNIRYNEDSKPTEFHFEDVEINEGITVGCIDCYCYQAGENPAFYESKLYRSLQGLKNCPNCTPSKKRKCKNAKKDPKNSQQ